MGGSLVSDEVQSPEFLIWAQKDPKTTSLQRLQVIKGWIDPTDGSTHEKVYDAACSDGLKLIPEPIAVLIMEQELTFLTVQFLNSVQLN